jgi:hypothetical protein
LRHRPFGTLTENRLQIYNFFLKVKTIHLFFFSDSPFFLLYRHFIALYLY